MLLSISLLAQVMMSEASVFRDTIAGHHKRSAN